MIVALEAASHEKRSISLGSVDTKVDPALRGHISVYVPLVDWRVQILQHHAPVNIALELRGINRKQASAGISSAKAADESLSELRTESADLVNATVRRGTIVAIVGGLIGAIVAGALLTATRLRRHWLLVAPLVGLIVTATVVGLTLRELHGLEDDEVSLHPTSSYAAELPSVLRYAAQLRDVGDEYEQHYETALKSVTNAADFAAKTDDHDAPEVDKRLFVISDFHDNAFVLDAFGDLVGSDSVVLGAGDWMQVGVKAEERLTDRLASLGSRFIAVSGNHDTASYMRSIKSAGAEVLDADNVYTTADDFLIAGYPDPLERPDSARGKHILRVYGEEYTRQRKEFISWWDQLPQRPDIVLVHQHGFAHELMHHLAENGDKRPLLLITGHDHRPHVHTKGPHTLIDAGTLGAGGLAAIGEQFASFVQIDLSDGKPIAAHIIEVEPLEGKTRSEHISLQDNSKKR